MYFVGMWMKVKFSDFLR